MAQIYNMISNIAFGLSALTFLMAVFFAMKFKVWNIIGDLSGSTARKSIAQMRADNEKAGDRQRRMFRSNDTQVEFAERNPNASGTKLLVGETESLEEQTKLLLDETTKLLGETELLMGETELLDIQSQEDRTKSFKIIQSIVYTQSEEII